MKQSYSFTIFLSAFLLFQVELIIGRELLPWFGGAPAVWTTCLVFFQVVLLAGYGYAHLVALRLSPGRQIGLHVTLLALSVLFLLFLALQWPSPITPGPSWKPSGSGEPLGELAILLAATVGIPFFILSTTGPLLQEWSVTSLPGRSPYRLYALSNAGSLLGLLGYPVLVEPLLGIHLQALAWSGLYLVFALGVIACAAARWKSLTGLTPRDRDVRIQPGSPAPGDIFLWVGLAGVSSALLLSTTNHMCQDTAVIPLLWVLPLSLYLATFILCFRYEGLYRRWLFLPLFGVALVCCIVNLFGGLSVSLASQIAADAAVLFTGCLVCHGELVRSRPGVAHLTGFYLAVAAGGAAGGLAVAIAAPRLFNGYWEFHASLWGTGALFVTALTRDLILRRKPLLALWPLVILLLVLGGVLVKEAVDEGEHALFVTRNFYGLLRVVRSSDSTYVKLLHGRITHGIQFTDPARAGIPTSYYSRESGIGLAIEEKQAGEAGIRIAVVGMGVGTIAAFAREQDTVRFYEINPAVPRLSRGRGAFFTYLNNCRGHVELAMGDARLSLEREIGKGETGRFDVLALDAFSSDAIPVHLLTEEAFAVYMGHLRKPDGILAVHITNRYVDLVPVVHGYAERHGLSSVMISADEDDLGGWSSDWILISPSAAPLAGDSLAAASTPWDSTSYRVTRPWTDDYSNMITLLRSGGEDR
ncbi:MAG TPA: ferrichrome ABC transporter permease [Bacteroidota bacterium]|nr:ferrichrome ABC transporter permease [Bacteroidota bacterium]